MQTDWGNDNGEEQAVLQSPAPRHPRSLRVSRALISERRLEPQVAHRIPIRQQAASHGAPGRRKSGLRRVHHRTPPCLVVNAIEALRTASRRLHAWPRPIASRTRMPLGQQDSRITKHQWSSGRIHRCHRCDPGSIPG